MTRCRNTAFCRPASSVCRMEAGGCGMLIPEIRGIRTEEETCEDLAQPGYQLWHLTIWRDPADDTLHAIYPAYPNGTNCDYCKLFYAVKETSQPWKVFPNPLMEQGKDGSWDDFCLYRTAFLLDREADLLRVWYGGKKKSDASWGIGYTEGQYSQICAALER